MRLTGAIPKQSNSTAQIWPPPWLNLQRKPELDLLPLELDFLYGLDSGLTLENLEKHESTRGIDLTIDKIRRREPVVFPP